MHELRIASVILTNVAYCACGKWAHELSAITDSATTADIGPQIVEAFTAHIDGAASE